MPDGTPIGTEYWRGLGRLFWGSINRPWSTLRWAVEERPLRAGVTILAISFAAAIAEIACMSYPIRAALREWSPGNLYIFNTLYAFSMLSWAFLLGLVSGAVRKSEDVPGFLAGLFGLQAVFIFSTPPLILISSFGVSAETYASASSLITGWALVLFVLLLRQARARARERDEDRDIS